MLKGSVELMPHFIANDLQEQCRNFGWLLNEVAERSIFWLLNRIVLSITPTSRHIYDVLPAPCTPTLKDLSHHPHLKDVQ